NPASHANHRWDSAMNDSELQQRDLEFRRQILRQAGEQVRGVDLGESLPSSGFRLDQRPATATPAIGRAPLHFSRTAAPGSAVAQGAQYRNGRLAPVEVVRKALD